MKAALIAAIVGLSVILGGCQTTSQPAVPSLSQINYYVPSQVRNCRNAPKAPGRYAGNKRRAQYIVKLYRAWRSCKGSIRTRNRLYNEYRKRLRGIKRKRVRRPTRRSVRRAAQVRRVQMKRQRSSWRRSAFNAR